MSRVAILVNEHVGFGDDLGWSNNEGAFKSMHIPNPNRLVAGTSNDFVPFQVSKPLVKGPNNLLVELKAVDAILVSIQIDRSGLASLPSLAQLLLDTVNVLPVIRW